ncbi:MAG: hypothetical protein VW685_08015, partial [Ilumatobacter sp.]
MRVHLVDGTYELFRQHFGATAGGTRIPGEFDATVGTLASTIQLLADGATLFAMLLNGDFRRRTWDNWKRYGGWLEWVLFFGLHAAGVA